VEQEITEVHMKELWERQHAARSQPPLRPNLEALGDESDMEALESVEARFGVSSGITAARAQAAAELQLALVPFAGMETQPCSLPTREAPGDSSGDDKPAAVEEDSFVVTTQEACFSASAPWTGGDATPCDATQPCKGPHKRAMPKEGPKRSKRHHGTEMCTDRKRGRRPPVRCE
jgi:hypothetical protein